MTTRDLVQPGIVIVSYVSAIRSVVRALKRREKDQTAIDALRCQAPELSPVSFHHPYPGMPCSEAALRAFLFTVQCAVAHQPFNSVELHSVTGLSASYKRYPLSSSYSLL